MQFWLVVEAQGLSENTASALVTAYFDYAKAESAYYGVLSAAAISKIPYHAAFLIDSQKGQRMSKIYDRSNTVNGGEATAE